MDSSKRELVRNSLFGALATVLPVTMLEAMAGEYVLGKMGKFSVRDGLVKSSKINPLAQDLIKTNQLKTSESISQYSISERK